MPYFEFTETSDTAWQIDCRQAQTGFQDVMAVVFRDGPNTPWRAVFRFRYVDDKVWESADAKNGYEMTSRDPNDPDACARMVAAMDLLAQRLAEQNAIVYCLPIHGNSQKFMEIWSQQEWGHVDIPHGPTGLRAPDEPQ